MKILILKPSSLGDVVQALPVLRLLKAQDPSREIYWWISAELVGLLRNDPDLTGLFLFQRQRWRSPRHWGEAIESLQEIRAQRFDWVIDLQGLARSALVGWLARGELTVGLEDWREGAPAFYDIRVPRPSPLTHAVDWYLRVLEVLRVPVHQDFVWIPVRPEAAHAVQKKWHPERTVRVAICPGARWVNKRWPVEHYRTVVAELARARPDVEFIVLGSRGDLELALSLCQAAPGRCLNLAGETSLEEMIEWVRLSDVLLTNDTGPMHVAAALQKPVVSLFGPTEPRRTGPYGQVEKALRIQLPCAPCLRPVCHFARPLECLRGISPEVVRSRVEAVLPVE